MSTTRAYVSPLDRARANFPEYEEAKRTRENLLAVDLSDFRPDVAFDELHALFLERAAAGPITPDDLMRDFLPIAMRTAAGELMGTVVTRCAEECRLRPGELDARHRDPLLEALHADLSEVVDAARALAPLAEIATPDAAFQSRRVDDHDAFNLLAARHARIREAQHTLAGGHYDQSERLHSEARYVKGVELLFPDRDPIAWLTARRADNPRGKDHAPWAIGTQVIGHGDTEPPWPNDARLDQHVAAHRDFLVWAIDHDAELWVPTKAEHAAEAERLTNLTAPDPAALNDALNHHTNQIAHRARNSMGSGPAESSVRGW